MKSRLLHAVLCAVALSAPVWATAQGAYPSQPVRLIVPFAPGGSVDIAARLISDAWGRALGQSVIVENRAGASGNIGMAAVARAQPNGYTLAINTMSLAINPALFKDMPFDTRQDLRSVGTVGTSQHVLTVTNALPVASVSELLAYVRARPANDLSFGSAGTGSTFHMAAELFKSVSKTQILHVPYKGGAPLMQDIGGGQVDLAILPLSQQQMSMAEQGRIKLVATLDAQRSQLPSLAAVPSVNEGQLLKGFNFTTWTGYFVKRDTPEDVVLRLHAALNDAMQDPAVKRGLEFQNILVSEPMGADAAEAMYRAETSRFRESATRVGGVAKP
ncbi:hypothetical protein G6F59_014009 [Rhizopus arrhizus]|nr:hypothetical protein G6F59_014009 [Rhizopus arrhizus]